MYKKHFSFKHKPFELVPNPDFIYLSNTHKKAITFLDYGIKENVGFVLLTGEIGSGKTTIIQNLIKNINGSIKLSRINNTKVSSEQLISMINEDFGLEVRNKNKTELLRDLNQFLIEQYSKKTQSILLVDEAQNLTPDLLEDIRLLSNLETNTAKLIQIILVGQPELRQTIMLTELKQLSQRINIRYHIVPLTIDEVSGYIKHRLTVAGNPDAIKIQEDMLSMIYKFSRGIPRLINILCDFVLLTAYTEGVKEVNIEIIRGVLEDLESSDYWRELHGDSKSEVTRDDSLSIAKTLCDIEKRLMKIEEFIKSNYAEISSLSDNLKNLEEQVFKLLNVREGSRLNSIVDRLEEKILLSVLSKISSADNIKGPIEQFSVPVRIPDNGDSKSYEISDEKSISEKYEFLIKNLKKAGNKLNNLKTESH